MKKYSIPIVSAVFLLIVSCKQSIDKKDNSKEMKKPETSQIDDPHSQSNAERVNPHHLDLDIKIDFDKHQIIGSATWDIKPENGVEEAVFDTQKMKIDSVLFADGSPADFEMGENDSILGAPLKIKLKLDTKQLKIFYRTEKDATALQWLEPEQTFGEKQPYLYTQGESIYTRTWVPSPDGPGFRFSYDAKVEVPKGLMALMSAENPQEPTEDGIYKFKMENKIPAYLMALAVGDIGFKAVDDRTGVYAETAILDSAYRELEDLDKIVDTAEGLYGKYRWGRYDVLILPSGFPMGGMENPRLTFATPTILAGDKSLVNLIAHELAHSWSGNLVTNATWDDFWLNEGFTVYFERRITEEQYDKDYAAMLWGIGKKNVEEEVQRLKSRQTWLKEDLESKDPEDGFTRIPYDKGAAFVLKIEQTVGREKLDEFLVDYFETHAFQSMTTEKFVDYLNENLLDGHADWKKEIDLDAWIYGPGIPDGYPEVDNPRFDQVDIQAQSFLDGTAAKDLAAKDWSTHEWRRFLGELHDDLSKAQMKDLDGAFDLTHTGNSEIANAWFKHAIQSDYSPAFGPLQKFLHITGRLKFLEPLYDTMMKNGKQDMAKEIYKEARPNYHPMAHKSIDRIVNE